MLGGCAGCNITHPKVFSLQVTANICLYSKDGYPSDPSESFNKGRYFVANAFWNVTSNLQAGIEYLRGKRIDFNDQGRHANRVNLSVQYSF